MMKIKAKQVTKSRVHKTLTNHDCSMAEVTNLSEAVKLLTTMGSSSMPKLDCLGLLIRLNVFKRRACEYITSTLSLKHPKYQIYCSYLLNIINIRNTLLL